jgi:hypothetical protein
MQMRRTLEWRVTPAIATGVIALVIGAAGGAYAAGSGATIVACVHKHGGALYEASRCAKGDKTLRWNKAGPAGPKGAAGPPGPATGVAGGSLAGNYPNPTIGRQTVAGATCGLVTCTPGQIKQASVNGRYDIASGSIGQSDLGADAVSAGQISPGPVVVHDSSLGGALPIAANTCATITFAVTLGTGAAPAPDGGYLVLVTTPPGLIETPAGLTSDGAIALSICNPYTVSKSIPASSTEKGLLIG